MKLIITSLAVSIVLGAAAASAQTLQLGPNGPSIDFRSPEQRDRDEWRERRRAREEWRERRRQDWDRDATGSIGRNCETVIVRERNRFGEIETHRERRCR
jgi:hypothetical protein